MEDKEEISFFIPEDDNDLTIDGKIYIKLYDVKMKGEKWRFNKNDKDTFPSKPHGHNLETGEKINIWTGEIWDKNKTLKRKFSDKKVLFIQSKLRDRGFI
ncbi:MAG: hypothetical protein ABIG37_02310 [Nanoarchaeota archaeon]